MIFNEGEPMNIQSRLQEPDIELPQASNPAANYTNCMQTGNLLFVAGKGPVSDLAETPKGKLGSDYTAEEGYAFARQTGLDILAVVQLYLGSLDRVSRVVKIQGFVNATRRLRRSSQGAQWLLRSDGRGLRRQGHPRSIRLRRSFRPRKFAHNHRLDFRGF